MICSRTLFKKYQILLKNIPARATQPPVPKAPSSKKQNLHLKIKRCQRVSSGLLASIEANFELDSRRVEGLPLGRVFTGLLLVKMDRGFNHYASVKDIFDRIKQKRPNGAGRSVISSLDLYEKFSILFHSLFTEKRSKKVDYFKALRFLETIYSKFSEIERLSRILLVLVLEQSLKLVSSKNVLENLDTLAKMESKILGVSILNSLHGESVAGQCQLTLDELTLENEAQSVLALTSISHSPLTTDFGRLLGQCLEPGAGIGVSIAVALHLGFLFSFVVRRLTDIYKTEKETQTERGDHSQARLKYSLSLALVLTIETVLEVLAKASEKFAGFWACFGWFQCFSSSYYPFLLFMHRFCIFCALADFGKASVKSFVKMIYSQCWNASHQVSVFLDVFQNGKPLKTWIYKHIGEVWLARKSSSFHSPKPRSKGNGLMPRPETEFLQKSHAVSEYSQADVAPRLRNSQNAFESHPKMQNNFEKMIPEIGNLRVTDGIKKKSFLNKQSEARGKLVQDRRLSHLEKRDSFRESSSKLALDRITKHSQKIKFIATESNLNAAYNQRFNSPQNGPDISLPKGVISSFQPIPQFQKNVGELLNPRSSSCPRLSPSSKMSKPLCYFRKI